MRTRVGFRVAAAMLAVGLLAGIVCAGVEIGGGNQHLYNWMAVVLGAIYYPEFLSIAVEGDGFFLLNTERRRNKRSAKHNTELASSPS